MGDLSAGHLHRLVRFRVWAQLEIVLIAVRLHPIEVAFDDCRIDDQGGRWVIFRDFVEEHDLDGWQMRVNLGCWREVSGSYCSLGGVEEQ